MGCFVDGCLNCKQCNDDGGVKDHMCAKQTTGTYGANDKHGRAAVWPPGSHTLGGYSNKMVVHERFGILVPKTYPQEYVRREEAEKMLPLRSLCVCSVCGVLCVQCARGAAY